MKETSLYFKLINFDEIFNRINQTSRSDEPRVILINRIDVFDQENKKYIDAVIMKNCSEDQLSIIPSCECGFITGAFYLGSKCPKCHTFVTDIESNLSFLIWLETPEGVRPFISPIVLAILLNRYQLGQNKGGYNRGRFNPIPYMMNPGYKIERSTIDRTSLEYMEKTNFVLCNLNKIERGYNSFVDNFFKIIDLLEDIYEKNKNLKLEEKRKSFIDFLHDNKDKIFSRYLPFPNKVIMTMEVNELGKFIDKRNILNPLNVIRRLTGIDIYNRSINEKQKRVALSLIDMADFYVNYMKSVFFSKKGLIRQHIASTRCHFTSRCVITTIAGPHKYDEIFMPWSASMTLFRVHIIKALIGMGYSYKDALSMIYKYNKFYNETIDYIFRSIIAEASIGYIENISKEDLCKFFMVNTNDLTPEKELELRIRYNGGVRCLFNRNPSLHRGSIQSVRITKIKTDPNDNTISTSYLIFPAWNADVDGDELNLSLMLTKKAVSQMHNFDPHLNILSINAPNSFSNNIKLPRTIVSHMTNFLYLDEIT